MTHRNAATTRTRGPHCITQPTTLIKGEGRVAMINGERAVRD
jgi:hypothetical protein